MADQEKVPTTETEQFSIAEMQMELQRRKAALEGFTEGANYVLGAMIRSRGLTGKWGISDDLKELIPSE